MQPKTLLAMEWARQVITSGLSKRAEAGIKVRQPLESVTVADRHGWLDESLQGIVADELNVKEVIIRERPKAEDMRDMNFLEVWNQRQDWVMELELNTEITPELKREGMMREVVRLVQNARKQAGLNVDDRIRLALDTHDQELSKAIDEHAETIKSETLATELCTRGDIPVEGYAADVKVDGAELAVALVKA